MFFLLFSHDPEEGLEDDQETRRSYRQPRGYKARYRSSSKKVSDLLVFFLKCQYNTMPRHDNFMHNLSFLLYYTGGYYDRQ